MPLQYVLDEHLRGPLWVALQRHNVRGINPIDVVRIGDPGVLPLGTLDPAILLWAEREGRVLISLDKATLPTRLLDHLTAGHHSAGIFSLRRGASIPEIVEFLVLAAHASDNPEGQDRIEYVG